tara:strand:- start:14602 stop:15114 length:513 start_codon:yes stop_codon:yes gene_type:complete
MEWELKTVQIKDLKAYEKNPRTLSERQARLLSDSIGKFGLVEKPIVNTDLTIIGGHQRVEVLEMQGATEVVVWYPSKELDDKQVEECNIVLNRVGGDWDWDILGNSFDVGDLLTWGFDEDDLGLGKAEKPVKEPKPVISFEFPDKDTMLEYITTCERLAEESAAKMKVRG